MNKNWFPYELWLFVRKRNKWWLLPLLLAIVFIGFVVIFAPTTSFAPLIYTLI